MKTSGLAGIGDQNAPRSRGLSEPVTQSAENAGGDEAAQPLRLSSARANSSASFGSFPAVSSISRFSVQAMAVRRAGNVSPWQDQPEIRKFGWSIRLRKLMQERAPSASPVGSSSVTAPNLLSMTPAGSNARATIKSVRPAMSAIAG